MVVLFNIQIKIPSLSAKTVNRSVDLPTSAVSHHFVERSTDLQKKMQETAHL